MPYFQLTLGHFRVTRGRISSQCLKRNIRHSNIFKDEFGDELSNRTTYLPRMVADELQKSAPKFSEDDLKKIKVALAKEFKSDKKKGRESDDEASGDDKEKPQSSADDNSPDQTGQLVFFPPRFADKIAKLIVDLPEDVLSAWINGKHKSTKKSKDKNEKENEKEKVKEFLESISKESQSLTVDIALFGRMTTSDLVVNVEASCQVAHAISTHEMILESDYFTAMDDLKSSFATTQTEKMGAAFLGSGETETFFNSTVYYKYLNLDLDALAKHRKLKIEEVAKIAGVLATSATLANPTGKQNSFAAHSYPELIMVDVSRKKRPISYANAFLQPVEGGTGKNLMAESAKALKIYDDSCGKAFAPEGIRRLLMAVGPADVGLIHCDERIHKIDDLTQAVADLITTHPSGGAAT
ncbi:MAG: type I-E CRISPR-associated protein Cas7/Cse4/CasC [Nitrospinae bacterium]|nr:type I-E CRISPR-associated protein Cas7/Cse4/CasC [Nitrospinota bacterium]